MSLLVRCQCGHVTHARPDLAGKQLACPLCGRSCDVPTEESQDAPKPTLGMRLCTRCRKPLAPMETECAECGLDLSQQLATSHFDHPELAVAAGCLTPILFVLGILILCLSMAGRQEFVLLTALAAAGAALILLRGTWTGYEIVQDPSGSRLCRCLSLAGFPIQRLERDLTPVRVLLVDYSEHQLERKDWFLMLALMVCGVLPGMMYAYWVQKCKQDETTYYEMYFVSLADDQSQPLLKLAFRRREEMQALIQLLTSHIDVDVERT